MVLISQPTPHTTGGGRGGGLTLGGGGAEGLRSYTLIHDYIWSCMMTWDHVWTISSFHIKHHQINTPCPALAPVDSNQQTVTSCLRLRAQYSDACERRVWHKTPLVLYTYVYMIYVHIHITYIPAHIYIYITKHVQSVENGCWSDCQ